MCVLQEIFFLRDMMDNQCANIFSTLATIYESHSVKFAFIERNILHVYPQLNFFKTWFVPLYLSPPPLFFSKTVFPKTCFVFPIFIGGEICF